MTIKRKKSLRKKKGSLLKKEKPTVQVPPENLVQSATPVVGIIGWNSPRFIETHAEFLEALKRSIAHRNVSPIFFGISSGGDLLTLKNQPRSSSVSSGLNEEGSVTNHNSALRSHYWLPSRDIVADQIEILAQEENISQFVMVPWSISSLIGMLMATIRCGIPTLFLPYYSSWPVFSESGSKQSGKKGGSFSVPYSQCSMLVLLEVLGLARVGSLDQIFLKREEESHRKVKEDERDLMGKPSLDPAIQKDLSELVEWAGQRTEEMIKHKISPRRFFSQAAFHNAICVDMALGSSTETVLHLSALAWESEVPLPLSYFNEISQKIPQLAPMDRSGEFPIENLAEFGGLSSLLAVLLPFLQPSPTVTGKNIIEIGQKSDAAHSSFKISSLHKKHGGSGLLFGNLAREGTMFRVAGLKEQWYSHFGPAKVFNSEDACVQAIRSKKIKKGDVLVVRYCGPKGNPGMPYLRSLLHALEKERLEDSVAVLTDGRAILSGRTPALVHVSPEASVGSTLSIVQDGDMISWNFFDRTLFVRLTETDIKVRLSRWREQKREIKNSFLYRYAKYSSSSSLGAVLG